MCDGAARFDEGRTAWSPPRGLERHRLGRHLLHGAGDERLGGSDVRHVTNVNFPETPAKVFDTAKAAALIASDRFRPLTGNSRQLDGRRFKPVWHCGRFRASACAPEAWTASCPRVQRHH